jgi:hypothetical protein
MRETKQLPAGRQERFSGAFSEKRSQPLFKMLFGTI